MAHKHYGLLLGLLVCCGGSQSPHYDKIVRHPLFSGARLLSRETAGAFYLKKGENPIFNYGEHSVQHSRLAYIYIHTATEYVCYIYQTTQRLVYKLHHKSFISFDRIRTPWPCSIRVQSTCKLALVQYF